MKIGKGSLLSERGAGRQLGCVCLRRVDAPAGIVGLWQPRVFSSALMISLTLFPQWPWFDCGAAALSNMLSACLQRDGQDSGCCSWFSPVM